MRNTYQNLFLILNAQFPEADPLSQSIILLVKRPLLKVLSTLGILFVILFCILLWEGGLYMNILPKYREENLLGLSKKEVIERLGEPFFDPSKAFPYGGQAPASWAGAKPQWPMEYNGTPLPLVILYESPLTDCRIEFRNDHVANVRLLPHH
jgi:hypothetical protein